MPAGTTPSQGGGHGGGGRHGPPALRLRGRGRPPESSRSPPLPPGAAPSEEEGRRRAGVRCEPPPGKNPEGDILHLNGEGGEGEALRRKLPSAPPLLNLHRRRPLPRRATGNAPRTLPRLCRPEDGRGEGKPWGAVGSPTPWVHPHTGASTALHPSTRTPLPRRRSKAHGGRRGREGARRRGPRGEQLRWRVFLGGPPDRSVNHGPDGFVTTRRPSAALFDGPSRKPKGGGAPLPRP